MKDLKKHSDDELVRIIGEQGKQAEKAFYLLYHKYSPKLLSYCAFRLGSREEAEETLQDAWYKFHKSIVGGKQIKDVLPYLYMIARNICIDRFRSKKTEKNLNLEYYDMESIARVADPYNFQYDLEKDEMKKLINIAISNLDDIYKETLLLYWQGSLDFAQVAEVCGESVPCIRTRFSRGVGQIIKMLKPYLLEISK